MNATNITNMNQQPVLFNIASEAAERKVGYTLHHCACPQCGTSMYTNWKGQYFCPNHTAQLSEPRGLNAPAVSIQAIRLVYRYHAHTGVLELSGARKASLPPHVTTVDFLTGYEGFYPLRKSGALVDFASK